MEAYCFQNYYEEKVNKGKGEFLLLVMTDYLLLNLLSHHKQLENWTKFMEQMFVDIGQEAVQKKQGNS